MFNISNIIEALKFNFFASISLYNTEDSIFYRNFIHLFICRRFYFYPLNFNFIEVYFHFTIFFQSLLSFMIRVFVLSYSYCSHWLQVLYFEYSNVPYMNCTYHTILHHTNIVPGTDLSSIILITTDVLAILYCTMQVLYKERV